MAIKKNLTLDFEAVNNYPPIRFEIRKEISDSQVHNFVASGVM